MTNYRVKSVIPLGPGCRVIMAQKRRFLLFWGPVEAYTQQSWVPHAGDILLGPDDSVLSWKEQKDLMAAFRLFRDSRR